MLRSSYHGKYYDLDKCRHSDTNFTEIDSSLIYDSELSVSANPLHAICDRSSAERSRESC